jgi:hypothetical protein
LVLEREEKMLPSSLCRKLQDNIKLYVKDIRYVGVGEICVACILIILPVVLYGCETWSVTLKEEQRLRVYEHGVLRIFGPRRDEVTGEWRTLHNEELNDLYSSSNIIRVIKSRRWTVACSTYRGKRGAYRILVERPKGRRPLGRPRRRWEDNIQMDLQEVG